MKQFADCLWLESLYGSSMLGVSRARYVCLMGRLHERLLHPRELYRLFAQRLQYVRWLNLGEESEEENRLLDHMDELWGYMGKHDHEALNQDPPPPPIGKPEFVDTSIEECKAGAPPKRRIGT